MISPENSLSSKASLLTSQIPSRVVLIVGASSNAELIKVQKSEYEAPSLPSGQRLTIKIPIGLGVQSKVEIGAVVSE